MSIRSIIHLSDIHIYNTKRHEEYKQVFKSLVRICRKMKNIAFVITGDIMHAKTELSPESFDLASELFYSLSSIAPTFIRNFDMFTSFRF